MSSPQTIINPSVSQISSVPSVSSIPSIPLVSSISSVPLAQSSLPFLPQAVSTIPRTSMIQPSLPFLPQATSTIPTTSSNERIFTNRPDPYASNEAHNIYRNPGKPTTGFVNVQTGFTGEVLNDEYTLNNKTLKDTFKVAYTQWGDRGPIALIMLGVPSRRQGAKGIQSRMAPFMRTVAIDMLNLGDSDKILNYGKKEIGQYIQVNGRKPNVNPWDWVNDIDYVNSVMETLYPGETFTFIASDWSGGIAMKYAEKYNDRLDGLILMDPIAFDGYPVNEIQAIGRASMLPDEKFIEMMGASDQTFIQIFKTMVHKPDRVWNQYTYKNILTTYVDTDYERNAQDDGEDADSLTLRIKYGALKALADRSAVLAPAQLVPIEENKRGIDFKKYKKKVTIIWGDMDNMMPKNQAYRFKYAIPNAKVEIQMLAAAGHFVELDKPRRVSEIIINSISEEVGKDKMGDIFLGYTGKWKGDEEVMIQGLRRMYGIGM